MRRFIYSLALLTAAATAAHSANRATPLPDWSGSWKTLGSVALISMKDGQSFVRGTRDEAPLRAEYEEQYKKDLEKALRQGDPNAVEVLTDTNTLHCFAAMPRYIATPYIYQFIVKPQQTWIVVDKAVRQIFTDGRALPPDDARWPLMLGRSRGHWQGTTLVIETVDLRDDMWLDTTPLMLSAKASVTERIHLIDKDTLENQVTIRDPVKFTHEWSFQRRYVRLNTAEWPDDPELCGGPEDHNPIVNGRVTTEIPTQK